VSRRQAAQAFSFEDAVDRITVEMGQEVRDHEGEVIQRWTCFETMESLS
jgi:hypothetical protein